MFCCFHIDYSKDWGWMWSDFCCSCCRNVETFEALLNISHQDKVLFLFLLKQRFCGISFCFSVQLTVKMQKFCCGGNLKLLVICAWKIVFNVAKVVDCLLSWQLPLELSQLDGLNDTETLFEVSLDEVMPLPASIFALYKDIVMRHLPKKNCTDPTVVNKLLFN